MNTIKGETINTLIINKSTFTTYLKNVDSVTDAKAYVNHVKSLHPDATHHVVVMTIGKTGEYGQCNDDGEPSGTAGMPILDVFRKNDLTNFVCIVVRYFGGIKLGAGGLVRAYSKSASTALSMSEITPIITYKTILLTFAYPYLDIIENRLQNYQVLSKSFTQGVSYLIKVPTYEVEMVVSLLVTLTNNAITININDEKDQ